MAVAAQALLFDGQITIDRALNGPTLTVRYDNARAALVELRVNGESVATRTVNSGKNSGETTFSLDLASLKSGDNKVEVRLFDKSGQMLASQTTVITADSEQGPVFVASPKMGATVHGNVDIKVGFSQQVKNSYVSFFIDNQFKALSNVPPFEFTWDTTQGTNGWHEIEAWVIDDNSTTFKTKKIRVFVQNGGRTERPAVTATTAAKPAVKSSANATVVAKPPLAVESTANNFHVGVAGTMSTKPATLQPSVATGLQAMLPTGMRLAKSAAKPATKPAPNQVVLQTGHTRPSMSVINNVTHAAETGMISITKGQRLPNIGSFVIVYNTQFVNFDVQPRVEDGVPLTPLRYLLEKAGGKVDWANKQKNVSARADGRDIFLHIGDAFAQINKQRIELERPSFIDSGRTIVPLSFMRDALNVNIDYDKASGHVLITSIKK